MQADDPRSRRDRLRHEVLRAVETAPDAYVVAVEARGDGCGETVVHVARDVAGARAYCLRQPQREYLGDARLHLVPHRLDAPDDDHETGTVSVAVYGIRAGSDAIEDLIGTSDE